jgi:hypothetical protein
MQLRKAMGRYFKETKMTVKTRHEKVLNAERSIQLERLWNKRSRHEDIMNRVQAQSVTLLCQPSTLLP